MKRATLRYGLAILLIAAGTALLQAQQNTQQQEAERQRQEAARIAAEQERIRQEAIRKENLDAITAPTPVPISRITPKQVTERCLAQAMNPEAFDVTQIPLKEWLARPDTTPIPWKVDLRKPELRIDQRYEVAYGVEVTKKDLKWVQGRQELRYISGVSNAAGQFLVAPKLGNQMFDSVYKPNFRVRFSDCVFLPPGDYLLWIVLIDTNNTRRNVIKRNVHVPEFSSDELPKLLSSSPAVEFPEIVRSGQRTLPKIAPRFVLPVANKQPIHVEVVSMLSPADQWSGRVDIVRWVNNRVLNATAALSQIQLQNGSISTSALDLVNQSMPFQDRNARQLNWSGLASAFTQATEDYKVNLPALEALKQHATFLRKLMNQSLAAPNNQMHAYIFVSGSLSFERGSEVAPVTLEGNCNCRAYHVRLRVTKDDDFDDLEKVIKPLHPKTFNILTPREFREALGEIIKDLNQF